MTLPGPSQPQPARRRLGYRYRGLSLHLLFQLAEPRIDWRISAANAVGMQRHLQSVRVHPRARRLRKLRLRNKAPRRRPGTPQKIAESASVDSRSGCLGGLNGSPGKCIGWMPSKLLTNYSVRRGHSHPTLRLRNSVKL